MAVSVGRGGGGVQPFLLLKKQVFVSSNFFVLRALIPACMECKILLTYLPCKLFVFLVSRSRSWCGVLCTKQPAQIGCTTCST
jgi:hypothetical protein